jgi:hypothetical protein
LIDGGELWTLRRPDCTTGDDLNWYVARKYEVTLTDRWTIFRKADEWVAPCLPGYLTMRQRQLWPQTSIAFAVYDGGASDDLFSGTITDLLNTADDYVWIWAEDKDYRVPEGAARPAGYPPGAIASRRKAIADAQAAKQPLATAKLLYGGFGDTSAATIATNINFISAQPFDGLILMPGSPSWDIADSKTKYTYDDFAKLLAPLKGLNTGRLTDNFVSVMTYQAGDMFDDSAWESFSRKLSALARASRKVGLRGIVLDNEAYSVGGMDLPNALKLNPHRTADQYYAQAACRGRQVARAMLAEYPDIRVLIYNSAIFSLSNHPWAVHAELWGAFQAGMLEEIEAKPILSKPARRARRASVLTECVR